jgi:hypothetical protein
MTRTRPPRHAGRRLGPVLVAVWLGWALTGCGPTTCDERIDPGTRQLHTDQPARVKVCTNLGTGPDAKDDFNYRPE